jgi:hypothetical protein
VYLGESAILHYPSDEVLFEKPPEALPPAKLMVRFGYKDGDVPVAPESLDRELERCRNRIRGLIRQAVEDGRIKLNGTADAALPDPSIAKFGHLLPEVNNRRQPA